METNTKANPLHYLHISLVFCLLLASGIMFFVMPKKTISIIEKRKLTPFPEYSEKALASGNYTRQIDEYFADNFPERDAWIWFSNRLRDWRGWHAAQGVRLVRTASPEFIPQEVLPDTAKVLMKDSAPKHSLLIYDNKAYQLFGSSKKMAAYYASCLNTFQKALGDSVRFYSVVVPSSSEMSLPEKYLKSARSEKANIQTIYDNMNVGICTSDAYSQLIAHKTEYLYFRTDHHWTALGAYYAYTAFASCAGFDAVPLESMVKKTKKNFLGTLYALSQDEELRKNPDYVDYYLIPGNYKVTVNQSSDENKWTKGSLLVESAGGSASYGVFLGSDFPVMKIQSDNANGRKILVLKESFGNAFVPFMAPHFETIFVADIRYFQFGLLDFIRKNGINEVLVINGIFMANNPYFGSKIKSMIYKPVAALAPKKEEK